MFTASNTPLIIAVEGNIGSGKSTITHYFNENFNDFARRNFLNKRICYLQEPVSEWTSFKDESDGKNIIEKFYGNNNRYAFSFQMMAYISRLAKFHEAIKQNYDIIFTERSMLTDRNVFAKMLHESGKIESIEYQIYNKWFDEFAECLNNMKIIYVKTNPETCHKRIIKRNRAGEDIPLEYLQSCHEYHENWLIDPSKKTDRGVNKNEIDVSVIDGNHEMTDIDSPSEKKEYFEPIMQKALAIIKEYINEKFMSSKEHKDFFPKNLLS